MRLDGGTSLCHILIEQPSILDFALYDHINGHSIILRTHLRYTLPPNAEAQQRAAAQKHRELTNKQHRGRRLSVIQRKVLPAVKKPAAAGPLFQK
jgi:hypothetical protein